MVLPKQNHNSLLSTQILQLFLRAVSTVADTTKFQSIWYQISANLVPSFFLVPNCTEFGTEKKPGTKFPSKKFGSSTTVDTALNIIIHRVDETDPKETLPYSFSAAKTRHRHYHFKDEKNISLLI